MNDSEWCAVDIRTIPNVVVKPPGPKSLAIHQQASEYMKGYSSQVRLFPVVFESGTGYTLTDVDGNVYIDLSSGIYVTGCGHCHPRINNAIKGQIDTLLNCHDFTTPVKAQLLEKLSSITPGDLNGIQFYSDGTAAVEAALRIARAATEKHEFISFHGDFHGKTLGAVSLATMDKYKGIRAAGFFRAPEANCYRCAFKMKYPECGVYCVDYLELVLAEQTTQQVAAIVIEPIQGWRGSIVPPDGYFHKLRDFCDKHGILLIADEILTGMGRTGKMFCVEHWDVVPDMMVLGKGLGNGYPVTAVVVSDRFKDQVEKISASTSHGGNPVACAAALASIETIEQEGLLEKSAQLGEFVLNRLRKIQQKHEIVGHVRGKGCLLGMELVKDRESKEPFVEAGRMVYRKACERGLAWIPAEQNLRMSPPFIMPHEVADKALDIIEEAIEETEKELGL